MNNPMEDMIVYNYQSVFQLNRGVRFGLIDEAISDSQQRKNVNDPAYQWK